MPASTLHRLIGVCAEKDPVYIVMEFMPGGAFLDFLRKKGCNQTKKKLCGMCVNACQVRSQDLLRTNLWTSIIIYYNIKTYCVD